MMTDTRCLAAIVAAVFAAACSQGGSPLGPVTPRPAAITMVSGDGQEGETAWSFRPFEVRVTDASGSGIANVRVTWQLQSGTGQFRISGGPSAWTHTDGWGHTKIIFGATGVGPIKVAAAVEDTTIPPVVFTASATLMVVHLNVWTSGFAGPDGSPAVTVPAGTPIEWRVGSPGHIIASSVAPADGPAFRSHTLNVSDTFMFTPPVAGTWTYVCELHENEGTGTLTVK